MRSPAAVECASSRAPLVTHNSTDQGRTDDGRGQRLDSWKEIAAYIKRDVRTAQRWEKQEGLPVHRLLHDERGTAYAYTGEIDKWLDRHPLRDHEAVAAPAPVAEAPASIPTSRIRASRRLVSICRDGTCVHRKRHRHLDGRAISVRSGAAVQSVGGLRPFRRVPRMGTGDGVVARRIHSASFPGFCLLLQTVPRPNSATASQQSPVVPRRCWQTPKCRSRIQVPKSRPTLTTLVVASRYSRSHARASGRSAP
jgi:hypothetical protein